MRRELTLLMAVGLLCGIFSTGVYAQKGVGDYAGVARQGVKLEDASLSGKVVKVEVGPCKNSTGRASVGAHFLLKTDKGKELNVHLGPAGTVGHIAKQLSEGKKVTVDAFRTAKMQENHYVARSIKVGETTLQLRDENSRPVWAGGNGNWRGSGGRQYGYGYGQDAPARNWSGNGYGRGPGWARGQGRGWGRGQGQGWGRGQGQGWRRGQGQGWGRR